MNDFSTKLFNYVRDRVKGSYPSCFCTTAPVSSTDTKLPALYMDFSFPAGDESLRDSSGIEKWTRHVCEAEVYSGESYQEARGIASVADEAMQACGFRRTSFQRRDNLDPTVRRMAISWRAQLDASGNAARY